MPFTHLGFLLEQLTVFQGSLCRFQLKREVDYVSGSLGGIIPIHQE